MRVVVVAPHPDDEALGCGGTLLRIAKERPGAELHWVIVTSMPESAGYSAERLAERESEIAKVAERLSCTSVHRLGFPAAGLDRVPIGDLISELGNVFRQVEPDTVFLPYRHDVHTDHRRVFDAAAACTKRFRYPSVRRVLAYETISETEFSIDPATGSFKPNLWIDISDYLDAKLELLALYGREMGAFPFPRSPEAVRALAQLRGSTASVHAAECFMLLKGLV